MKKTIILTALVAFLFGTINTISAQDDSRRQEFMARQTERLVKNLKLDGDKKTQFEAIYKRYQEELAATRQQQARQRDRQPPNLLKSSPVRQNRSSSSSVVWTSSRSIVQNCQRFSLRSSCYRSSSRKAGRVAVRDKEVVEASVEVLVAAASAVAVTSEAPVSDR